MDPADSLDDLIPPPTEVDNTHRVYSVAIGCIVVGILSTIVVLVRLGHRWRTETMGNDDFAMMLAIILYIAWTVLAAYMNLHAGVGKPLWEITVGEYQLWFQGILASAWLYPIMSAAIRVSITLFYLRMFGTRSNGSVRYLLWGLLVLQGVYIATFSILPAFICSPVYYFWRPTERHLHCSDWYYYYTQVGLFSASMAFDVILLVFPLYPVSKLQLPVRKRVGVATIFMLGAAASVAAAYKLAVFVLQMERYTPTDPTWLQYLMSRYIPAQFDRYGLTFWIPTQIEPTVALIGASMPALYHLLSTNVPKLRNITSWVSRKTPSGATDETGPSDPSRRFYRVNDSQVELRRFSQETSRSPQ